VCVIHTAIERHTLTVMEELREQNRTTISLLQQLLARSATCGEDCELPGGLVVPVQTLDEIDRLNAECADSDVRGKLVCGILSVSIHWVTLSFAETKVSDFSLRPDVNLNC